jgi:peptidyl-prolyl cis-trans isomerase SurA
LIRRNALAFAPPLLLACLFAPAAARAEIKERVAAVVNGQPIALSDVLERVQVELSRISALPDGAEKVRSREDLLKRGLDQLIDEKLVEAEANQLGIDVGEDEVQKQVEALAKQNSMDAPQFREAVQAQGMNWDTVRDSLRKQALQFRVLQLKVKPRKVSDEELQSAYAAANANPEYEVRARHIFIATPAKATPQQLDKAKARAEEALRRIRAGEEFALVGRDLSEGPSAKEGGDLGYFRRGSLFPEADQATFALDKGEVSQLLHTSTGYHLFKVEDRRAIPARPLGEVADELRNRIINDSVLKERENYLHGLRKGARIDVKL